MNEPVGFRKHRAVIISIMILIALIHVFRIGSYLQGEWYNLYYSYFSDLILPFGFYFLLSADEVRIPVLRSWKVKSAVAFAIPAIAETCQYFGLPVLGSTFDFVDYIMYGVGVGAAAVFDTQILSKRFKFWTLGKIER